MTQPIEVEFHPQVTGGIAMVTKIDDDFVRSNMAHAVMLNIARAVADRYVAENYQKIVGLISPEAIATLSAAEAAAKIRETLEKKLPDKILEVTKTQTEIYQRGIFGGLKRL